MVGSEQPDRDVRHLRSLLPDLSETEFEGLWVAEPDEFSIAENLGYYSRDVGAISRGALFFIQELEATYAYRKDLDDQIRQLSDTPLRTYVVTQLDVVDVELINATVQQTPRWRSSLTFDGWWWHRTPRRTDQRLFLESRWERTIELPEQVQRLHDEWMESGDSRPFAEWRRAQRVPDKG
jgi:hypothetical protein